jgi:hypothetical protein
MRSLRSVFAAVAASLAIAAPAAAAPRPIDLGPGTAPSQVADPAGTAHMVFRSAPDDGIVYCRLPRGARACDVRTALPIGGVAQYYDIYRRADGVLIAVQTVKDDSYLPLDGQGGTLWASVSADNGTTFSAPAPIAGGIDDFHPAGLAPDGQSLMLMYDDAEGILLRRAPFAGQDARTLNVEDTQGTSAGASFAALPDGRALVAHTTLDDVVAWRLYAGGDLLDANAWPVRGVVTGARGTWMVTGPRGVFLRTTNAYSTQYLPGAAPVELRAFDTKRLRWRKPRGAMTDQQVYNGSAVAQDAGGRLHVAVYNAGLGGLGCIVYARTGTKSSQWFGRSTRLFLTRSKNNMPDGVAIAAGSRGSGFATWSDATGHAWATPLRQAKGRARTIAAGPRRQTCGGR